MGHELAHNPTVQIYPTHSINAPLSYFEPYQSPLQVLQKYELCPPPPSPPSLDEAMLVLLQIDVSSLPIARWL